MTTARTRSTAKSSPGAAHAFLAALVVFGLAILYPSVHSAQAEQVPTPAPESHRRYDSEFNPAHQKPISSRSQDRILSLKSSELCSKCPGGRVFIFELKDERRGKIGEFRIENETAQIDEIHILNDSKVAVIGRMQWAVSVVNVVDLRSGKLSDSFWCMRPSVSDDNRFVAYVKVFPLHFVSGVSYQYLVYDLTATPEENRTPPNKGRMSDTYDVGWPVYPEGLLNTPGDNILKDESLAHLMSSDGFFWLDRQDMFAFTDCWKGVQRLILVSLVSGISHPKIRITPLTNLGIVDVAKCKDFSESTFQVSQIELAKDKPGYLRLSLSSSNPTCILRPTLDIALTNASLTKRSAS